MNLPPVMFHGSVKTVRGVANTAPYIFEFTDNYSIFDWGAMPDKLTDKGESLAFISNLLFRLLEKKEEWEKWSLPGAALDRYQESKTLKKLRNDGLVHHGLGLVDKTLESIPLNSSSKYLAVKPVKILKPEFKRNPDGSFWDYTEYEKKPLNTLVPLEIIFRFSVPKGSSLLERANDKEYCRDIGLLNTPREGDVFNIPIIEFSTKLESSDRYITYHEAMEMAGLDHVEFNTLFETATLLALRLKDYFNDVDVKLHDGKFEFAFSDVEDKDQRSFMLVDVITPDELRLSYKNVPLSKENLRNYYRKTSWCENVKKAKKIAEERGEKDWKTICETELGSTPPSLDPTVKKTFSMIYKSIANTMAMKHLEQNIFFDSWGLDKLISKM
ncbi:MAG: hypothetical protein KAQ98_04960 [Bacteriovoracaceae bacterium]|nr:hypothetical protein [Bacteriovoracaceae bacterium]